MLYCGAESISRGHHRNGGMFFSVMSRNVPDKVNFIESSPKEEMDGLEKAISQRSSPPGILQELKVLLLKKTGFVATNTY
ncbi:hypothetical protein TNCV_3722731 [Trichonephila clavipes]|nr:hypothetical protein TNCV_3722731 [Trichonephila clavipes]